jgi:hypothetical protein
MRKNVLILHAPRKPTKSLPAKITYVAQSLRHECEQEDISTGEQQPAT